MRKSTIQRIADDYASLGKEAFSFKLLEIEQKYKGDPLLRKFCISLERMWVKNGYVTHDDPWNVFLRSRQLKGVTKEKMVLNYGEELGLIKWDEYCKRQSVTNTLEYKKEKYGWTEEQFKEYNKGRAATLENMIARHGEEEGRAKWDEYCERQAYAGCKLEYFVEKYGEEEGNKKYNEVNLLKGHTLEAYVHRYGDLEAAAAKLIEVKDRAVPPHSKAANTFFEKILPLFDGYKVHTHLTTGREYGVLDTRSNKFFYYDFVVPELKLCIEFNGVFWHAKPGLYDDPERVLYSGKTVSEIREYDENKIKTMRELRGFDVIIVWEDETDKMLKHIEELYGIKNDEDCTLNRFFY